MPRGLAMERRGVAARSVEKLSATKAMARRQSQRPAGAAPKNAWPAGLWCAGVSIGGPAYDEAGPRDQNSVYLAGSTLSRAPAGSSVSR